MNLAELVAVASIVGILIAVVTFVMNWSSKTRDNINEYKRTIFRRLDDHKDYSDGTFVRKDTFEIMYRQLLADLVELKADMKMLLKKNGVK